MSSKATARIGDATDGDLLGEEGTLAQGIAQDSEADVLDAEYGPDGAARLRAALAESEAQIARGEVVPAEVVLAELDAILFDP